MAEAVEGGFVAGAEGVKEKHELYLIHPKKIPYDDIRSKCKIPLESMDSASFGLQCCHHCDCESHITLHM